MKKLSYKINQQIGNFTVIDDNVIESKIKVKCICKNEFSIEPYRLKTTNLCKKCARGFYPGVIIDGCELIERISGVKWKIRCRCGNIYENCPRFDRRESGLKFRDCGCTKVSIYMEKAREKIGYKFGKLKVIDVKKGHRHNILICKCKCGKVIEFTNGHECKRNSCGCLLNENNPRAEKKGNARFKNAEILSMREFYQYKVYTLKELSEMFDTTEEYMIRIIKGNIWKSLPTAEENKKNRPRPKRKKNIPS